MHSSPSEIPSPEFAPSRQRSPTEITVVPPPDRVPWMEAPPRTSEPSPTTTPAEMRRLPPPPPRREAPLDHRRAERAGVVVDEPLVHHGRALGEVRAEPNPVAVGDPHAGRDDVVHHPGELVHAEHGQVPHGGAQPVRAEPGGLDR